VAESALFKWCAYSGATRHRARVRTAVLFIERVQVFEKTMRRIQISGAELSGEEITRRG
jgi:hypothetical protein